MERCNICKSVRHDQGWSSWWHALGKNPAVVARAEDDDRIHGEETDFRHFASTATCRGQQFNLWAKAVHTLHSATSHDLPNLACALNCSCRCENVRASRRRRAAPTSWNTVAEKCESPSLPVNTQLPRGYRLKTEVNWLVELVRWCAAVCVGRHTSGGMFLGTLLPMLLLFTVINARQQDTSIRTNIDSAPLYSAEYAIQFMLYIWRIFDRVGQRNATPS